MGIKVGNPPTQPALTFDSLQVDSYTVRVGRAAPYPYRVEASLDYYAIDANGERQYANKSFSISTNNFLEDFVPWLIAQGLATDQADAATKLEQAKAQVGQDFANGAITPFQLFAMFQLGIGLQARILKNIDIMTIG